MERGWTVDQWDLVALAGVIMVIVGTAWLHPAAATIVGGLFLISVGAMGTRVKWVSSKRSKQP